VLCTKDNLARRNQQDRKGVDFFYQDESIQHGLLHAH
jgi:hypothetical protein